jgi:hypothetical protein
MKNILLAILFLFWAGISVSAPVQGDGDSNGALDVAKGGTNSTSAGNARTALDVPATAATLVGDCTVGPCLDGSTDGGNLIKLWAGTGSYWTALQGGAPAANRSWRLPTLAAPSAGETNVMTMDENGQMNFIDKPSTTGYVLSSTDAGVLSWIENGSGGSMTYPGAGIPNSTGSAWGTSYTLDTDISSVSGSDDSIPSAKATKSALDGKQAADSDLTTWAGITPGTGVGTMLASAPGSAGGPTTTIAAGTSALGTGAITSGSCATVVTTTATNTATTDVINWGFNGDPTGVTGYAASADGMLTIIAYPSTNNVNFKVCNNLPASVTPGAITLNWRVQR